MASDDDQKMNKTVGSIMATVVGIIMICSVMIPIVSSQINAVEAMDNLNSSLKPISSLIAVVVMMTVVGLIVAVVKGMNRAGDR